MNEWYVIVSTTTTKQQKTISWNEQKDLIDKRNNFINDKHNGHSDEWIKM